LASVGWQIRLEYFEYKKAHKIIDFMGFFYD
jgi:hypothetical protein